MSMYFTPDTSKVGFVPTNPLPQVGQKDAAPAPLDLNDKSAVGTALKALVDQELSAGWDVLLKAPASTEFRHALADLHMHARFDEAKQCPKKEILGEIPGDRLHAIKTVLEHLSPSGLAALKRSVGDGAEVNEFTKCLSPQDRWLMVAAVHRQQADDGDVLGAYWQGLGDCVPEDKCRVRAQKAFKPVHATYLQAIAAFKGAAADCEAKGLHALAAAIWAAISEIWAKILFTADRLNQPEQVEHARPAARTSYNESLVHSQRAVDAALQVGDHVLAEQYAREAAQVAQGAADQLRLYRQFDEAIAVQEQAIAILQRSGATRLASDAQMQLGDFYIELERYGEAADTYRAGLREHHRDPSMTVATRLVQVGSAYTLVGKDDDAKVAFDQAGDVYMMLAKATGMQEAAHAADHFNQAGKYYLRAGQDEKAKVAFEHAGDAHMRLAKMSPAGNAEAKADHYDQAGRYYLRAQRYRNAIDALHSLEQAHKEAGARGKAESAVSQMAKTYELLAQDRALRGEWKTAIKAYERAAELFDSVGLRLRSPESYERAAAVYQTQVDIYLRRLLSREPGTSYFAFASGCREVARLHRAAGDRQSANIAERTAAAAYAKELHFSAAAECHFRTGDRDRAIGTYQLFNQLAELPTLHPGIFLSIVERYRKEDPVNYAHVALVMDARKVDHLDAVDRVDWLAIAARRVMGDA